jgi:hypothetical protein
MLAIETTVSAKGWWLSNLPDTLEWKMRRFQRSPMEEKLCTLRPDILLYSKSSD